MPKLKVLNLYAGIGGNRKLWPNDKIDVTAVEIEPKIAKIYQDFFLNDKVIVTDAHQFLLDHFKEFDFIWSSPPCPTHSFLQRIFMLSGKPKYPDMRLYEEIILLKHFHKGLFCIENVVSYYEPLIEPVMLNGHYFWANFFIQANKKMRNESMIKHDMESYPLEEKAKLRDIDLKLLESLNNDTKHKVLNNMVMPKTAEYIFNMAFKDKQVSLNECSLFKEKTQI